jgi:hypothetical protein
VTKLAQLPDHVSVKGTINIPPSLHGVLQTYVEAYADVYGHDESIVDLVTVIPAISTMIAPMPGCQRSPARLRGIGIQS